VVDEGVSEGGRSDITVLVLLSVLSGKIGTSTVVDEGVGESGGSEIIVLVLLSRVSGKAVVLALSAVEPEGQTGSSD